MGVCSDLNRQFKDAIDKFKANPTDENSFLGLVDEALHQIEKHKDAFEEFNNAFSTVNERIELTNEEFENNHAKMTPEAYDAYVACFRASNELMHQVVDYHMHHMNYLLELAGKMVH